VPCVCAIEVEIEMKNDQASASTTLGGAVQSDWCIRPASLASNASPTCRQSGVCPQTSASDLALA
jgi:hypothetical protein